MFQLCGTIANKKKTLKKLLETISSVVNSNNLVPKSLEYDTKVEYFINYIEDDIKAILPAKKKYLSRFVALKLLEENESINEALNSNLNINIDTNTTLQEKLLKIKSDLNEEGLELSFLRESVVSSIMSNAEEIRKKVCTYADEKYNLKTRKIDKILTSKKFGIPIMLAFLALIFWITISLANYPSSLLSDMFGFLEEKLLILFYNLHISEFWTNILIHRYV